MAEKRIIEYEAASELANDDWLLIDGVTEGTRKARPSTVTAELGEQVTNIATAVSGLTAELVGIRVGADGVTYPSAGDAVRGQINEIVSKMTKVQSNNFIKSDTDMSSGYVAKDGSINASTSYVYTTKIQVNEGDVVRCYSFNSGAFVLRTLRFVCAYNAANEVIALSGVENVTSYTVPTNIKYVVLTIPGSITSVNQVMVTRNYEATTYEPYFDPYYIATEDFIKNVLDNFELPEDTVKSYNLIPVSQNGVGAYYANGNKPKYESSYTNYHYCIMNVKPNTRYFISTNPRWWILTDDNDNVISSGGAFSPTTKKYIDTNNATKFYYTIDKSYWDNMITYGDLFPIIVSEGIYGAYENIKKPAFFNEISQNMTSSKFAFALPYNFFFTTELEQKWYFNNLLSLPNNYTILDMGENRKEVTDKYIKYECANAGNIPIEAKVYDSGLTTILNRGRTTGTSKANNIQNCSALVIGDSTVDQNTMTQKMLDIFESKSKVLTLLGTRGTSPNNHEGRAGWSAAQYCTISASGSINNPFYNPTTESFDFSYYMQNQNYSSVDFVVIQLGINDLYNVTFENTDERIETTANYIKEIIDSILSWNASQKIIINLPTAINPNFNQSYTLFIRNKFVRYNAFMLLETTKYNINNVRVSYCHLILDPENDISDNVHPTAGGYEKMANEIVSQINVWQN